MTETLPSWLDDDAPRGPGDGRRDRRQRRRRGQTIVALILTLFILGLFALLILFVMQARTAQSHLRSAMPLVPELRQHTLSGDDNLAASTAAELQDHTGTARDALAGPHWSLAEHLPYFGPNVEAARIATEVVDNLSSDVLPELLAATDVVDPMRLTPHDGRIGLEPFQDVAPQVISAHEAVLAAQSRLGEIDPERIVSLLLDPLEDLQGQLDDVAALTATASRAVQLIPPMLGADEPRDYILMVQNNAEPRATGGLTGAFLHLRADDGAIELLGQRSAGEVGYFGDHAVELTDTEVALFGTQLARYPGNVTTTPHFPRSAEIITEMWRQGVGDDIDGVLSLDPVVLAGLLEATGPIEISPEELRAVGAPADFLGSNSELTAENTAEVMLNRVYREIANTADQDDFFELAAAKVFSRAMSGGADPAATIAALVLAADENRLHLWSAHSAEQDLITGTVLSGELRGDDGNGAPVVGVYLNDLSAAKIAYYQHMEVELVAEQCHANGAQDLKLRVTVASDVPEDAAQLPDSLAGAGRVVPKGDMRSNLLIYAPTGGRITSISDVDTGKVEAFPQIHNDQVMVARRIHLKPGEIVTTEVTISTATGYTDDAQIRMTPGPSNQTFTSFALTCRH